MPECISLKVFLPVHNAGWKFNLIDIVFICARPPFVCRMKKCVEFDPMLNSGWLAGPENSNIRIWFFLKICTFQHLREVIQASICVSCVFVSVSVCFFVFQSICLFSPSVFLSICLSVYLAFSHSVYLSLVFQSVCMSVYLDVTVCQSIFMWVFLSYQSCCMSFYMLLYLSCHSICLWIYLHLSLSICQSVCKSFYLSVSLSVCESICLSICLSACLLVCPCPVYNICIALFTLASVYFLQG